MASAALAGDGKTRRGLAVALVALVGLAGCGFRPLYGEGEPAAAMGGRIEVALLDGAPGFAMRERLTQRLGAASAATHRLETTLVLERTGVALTQENVTTRYDVSGVATYRLVPLAGGPPVTAGTVRTVTGYSVPAEAASSAFASRAAERDAEERLAVTLADQIVERLALTSAGWLAAAR
jgi:LPS-assembly lipoprotein